MIYRGYRTVYKIEQDAPNRRNTLVVNGRIQRILENRGM